MNAIELTGLTKHFGDVTAVDGIDLTVEEGEIFGFLGPNGAGKSTAINIMLDFARPTSGSVTVLGMDAQEQSLEVRRRVGVLPDGYHVYDRLTGRQHVQFVVDSKGVDDDAEAILDRVGILEAADRKAGGYSKGMKQRLVLGMALVGDPDLLVLDEPTTGLDPNGAREIREIIREERDRGATVFFSSHILEQVEAVCDRVAILNEGRLVALDSIQGLRSTMEADTVLSVTVDRPFEDDVDDVEQLPGVTSVVAEGPRLTVSCESGAKTAVLDAVESMGYDVTDFGTEQTSLEDLFMAFTSDRGAEQDVGASEAPMAADGDGEETETDESTEVAR
jgi:ABC-2 type transport system ATP-binding protein